MMVQFDVKRVQKGTESFMVSFDFTKTPITQIADYIIISASKHNSSDIHFDPREDGMMVRFRIDGDCQDYTFVPKAYEKNLTTRLKLLANMNITESRLPQDGAIKGTFGDQYLDMRVSALPLNEGEKIVIRILDYSRSLQGVDTLGFHPKNLEKIKRMMGIPNGIILTTGATGSGKSTTTYSILQGLNKPETNIITVEDPIEMNIEGINQVQVNAEIGMTFAAALRSILRQDPNVILIGEIRDSETAQIAVRASITGHLVLSTIHTNNALATVERLLDMDVERYLLSTALSGIISQRLAKMLCPDCRYQRETTKYEKKVFKKYMNMDVAHVWDANPKGCDHCRRGYHGRIAIHEVLEIDDDIRAALSNDRLDKKELAKMVYSGNTITMLQDALIKCLEGKTSFEEVYRTIEIENEDDDNYENEMATEIKESVPVEEVTTESDGLLDITVNKDDKDNVASVVAPPSFTAADFADTPEEGQAEETNGDTENNNQEETVDSLANVNTDNPTENDSNTSNEVNAVEQVITTPVPVAPAETTPVYQTQQVMPTPTPVNTVAPNIVYQTQQVMPTPSPINTVATNMVYQTQQVMPTPTPVNTVATNMVYQTQQVVPTPTPVNTVATNMVYQTQQVMPTPSPINTVAPNMVYQTQQVVPTPTPVNTVAPNMVYQTQQVMPTPTPVNTVAIPTPPVIQPETFINNPANYQTLQTLGSSDDFNINIQ